MRRPAISTSSRSIWALGLTLLATALLSLSIGAASASAAVAGNWCQDARWYLDNVGVEACLKRPSASSTAVTLQPGAYDMAKDGYSAVNYTLVWQLVGNEWKKSTEWLVINSAGYRTTEVGVARTIKKLANATRIYIRIVACRYDSPTRIYNSCDQKNWNLTWS